MYGLRCVLFRLKGGRREASLKRSGHMLPHCSPGVRGKHQDDIVAVAGANAVRRLLRWDGRGRMKYEMLLW